jgi:hypothetical protein
LQHIFATTKQQAANSFNLQLLKSTKPNGPKPTTQNDSHFAVSTNTQIPSATSNNNRSAQLHPLNLSVFCCSKILPVDGRFQTGMQQPLRWFSGSILRSILLSTTGYSNSSIGMAKGSGNTNLRMLLPTEHHLINLALYLVSYEKHFDGQQVEQTRYFNLNPNMRDWLEIPTDVFNTEANRRPFHHNDSYIKFNCDDHPNFLFVCRVLMRREGPEPDRVPAVKRTGPRHPKDKDDDGDEEYKMSDFSRDWPSPSGSWGGQYQNKAGENGNSSQGQGSAAGGEPFGGYDG